MLIYKITNLINEKIYIGQTTQSLKARLRAHQYSKTGNGKLYHAIKKYGIGNFKIEAIDSASNVEELNKKEINWITHCDAIKNGYNIQIGGQVNFGIHNPMYGKKLSKESIEKMKKSLTGRVFSEEHKKNLAKAAQRAIVCLNNNIVYSSIKEAAKALSLDESKICKVCKSKQKHTNGYRFRYEV